MSENITSDKEESPLFVPLPERLPVRMRERNRYSGDNSYETGPETVEAKGLIVPVGAYDLILKVEELGFFLDPKNFILFEQPDARGENAHYRFKILQHDPLRNSRRLIWLGNAKNHHAEKPVGELALASTRPANSPIKLLQWYSQTRFQYYPHNLVKNWTVFHYLDFYTNYSISWSEQLLKSVDDLTDSNKDLNLIGELLLTALPLEDFIAYASLPETWVKYAKAIIIPEI